MDICIVAHGRRKHKEKMLDSGAVIWYNSGKYREYTQKFFVFTRKMGKRNFEKGENCL